ncbi:hypothetical protein ACS0TY_008053 [Phlomoides rotata]
MGELGMAYSGGAERRSCFNLRVRGFAPPDLSSLSEDCLSAAEEAAQQVLNCIHPTLDSEEKRRDIVDYLQRLIKTHLNCEVFTYGSVPLKTYLPDGDIDFTVIECPSVDESLVHDVLSLLHREEKNENAEFQVKDTQFIDAEVKLVKCLVQNMVIDISFNQLGGLSTLCFLEQVDRLVGRNHLFKRSIILIKAWCYYESRILGAHHGLISTYALETLVLYIFHLFHSSLHGPLTVLYRFLEYYSQFDWDNYCISLKGPVCKSSLPDIVVKVPESGWTDLMLSDEFLENCMEMFSVSSKAIDGKPKTFQTKHLNVIDPLKENNNLGRSVHMGNFYRIRSAFKYGARKLGQVLSQSTNKVAEEIRAFFANTLARHGNDNKTNIQHLALGFGDEESFTAPLLSPVELFSGNNFIKSRVSDFYNDGVESEFKNGRELYWEVGSEGCYYAEGVSSGHRISVDTFDHATSDSSTRNGTPDYASSCNNSTSLSWNICHKPFLYSPKISAEIGNLEAGHHTSLNFRDVDLTSIGGESEVFNPLADLSGDYDSHIRSLLYGQLCHGFSLFASTVHHYPSVPPRIENKKQWDIVCESMPFLQSQFSRMSFHPKQHSTCLTADSASPAYASRSAGTQKARGTGTYFPRVNGFFEERPSHGRSRNTVSGSHDQFHRYGPSNGCVSPSPKSNLEKGIHDVLPAKSTSQGRGRLDERYQHPHSVGIGNQMNDDLRSFRIKFGSIGFLAEECSDGVVGPIMRTSQEAQGTTAVENQERVAEESVQLKDEVEFPPLYQ